MQRIEVERWPKNRVVALFERSAVSFDMAPLASLTDLVERLTNLGMNHDGALIGVTVRLSLKEGAFSRLDGGRDRTRDRQ